MVKRNRGKRGGHSRQQLGKHREKTTVNQLLQQFEAGEKVIIDIDSSVQNAMPHPRHQGKEAIVEKTRADIYEIAITDGKKKKTLIVGPAHLKKV